MESAHIDSPEGGSDLELPVHATILRSDGYTKITIAGTLRNEEVGQNLGMLDVGFPSGLQAMFHQPRTFSGDINDNLMGCTIAQRDEKLSSSFLNCWF